MIMEFDVVIVGGGPVGLFLAAELRLAGVEPVVLERLSEPDPLKNQDDRGLTARTVQTLGLRGLAEAAAEAAPAALRRLADLSDRERAEVEQETPLDFEALMESVGLDRSMKGDFAMVPLIDHTGELSDLSPPLMVLQGDFEQILADRALDLGVPVWRGQEVVDIAPDEQGVTAVLADGRSVRGACLVGCDGGSSTVRNLAGFDFPGTDPSMVARIAVAQLADPETLPPGFNRVPAGMLIVSPPPAPSMTIEFGAVPPDRHAEMTAKEFQASLRRISGTDVTVTDITSAYRITDNARQASTYRRGGVLLAGDAAHVHSPIGGQGLNLGLQDAANLGWKLGLVVRGLAPEDLLDTYTSERHPVGAQVLRNSRAETALLRTDPQTEALREIFAELVGTPRAARFFVEMINGVQVRYDCGDDAHSLAGRFVPDLRLSGVKGIGRISELLRDGRGLLLDLADSPPLRNVAAGWGDRVKVVTGACPDRDDLAALLVRPDGYVAWAASAKGEAVRERAELGRSLATWFGSDPMYR